MVDRLRSIMTGKGVDWFIVYLSDPHLSEYISRCDRYLTALSGFTGSAGTLLVGQSEAYLWIDSRYFVQAKDQLEGSGITLMRSGLADVPTLIDHLSEHVWDGQTIALDLMTVSFNGYRKLRDALSNTIDIVDGSAMLRSAVSDLPERDFKEIVSVPLKYCGVSAAAKISDVRKTIKKNYAHDRSYTYILSDITNNMWLFNLRGNDAECVPAAYSYAMITDVGATLYIEPGKLDEDAAKMLDDAGVLIRPYRKFYDDLEEIATDMVIADSCANNCNILLGFDEDGVYRDCSDCEIIRKAVKNSTEISGMKEAHQKDAVTVIKFIRMIKEMAREGTLGDEYDIGRMLDDMRIKNGASSLSFKTICAYRENAAVVHYIARKETAKPVMPEGFLLVDSGGQYKNLGTTDITRTISLGEVSAEEKKVYTTVLKGNLRLMNAIFPRGFKGTLLDGLAESVLWENGYFCGHGIGHGVGCYLAVHEGETRISRGCGERESCFFPGVIVSDEPGVYIEGKFGVRLENLLLTVASDDLDGNKMCAFEPLTLVPFDKESIDQTLLTDDEKDILSRYYELISEKILPLLPEDDRKWAEEYMSL
ncbi:MAG: M24 family metallopeptidase [Lachnospiraceae bacterium]|nr:M24 family metallopeptidase [Lachnospiraceae bacterium]